DDRAARLQWTTNTLKLKSGALDSWKSLTRRQTTRLIRVLLEALPEADRARYAKKRPDRATAQRYGREGRRSAAGGPPLTGPPDAATLQLLEGLKHRAFELCVLHGEEGFSAWLRSRSSPTRGSAWLGSQARCNQVIWALKKMIRGAERKESADSTDFTERKKQSAQSAKSADALAEVNA
ncbi:MAG TPA: hypothetical protein VNL38_03160, partial [Candidatus Nitrosotenuis sp.]|nr:hypothetical protein [Candidatus Nitrosotenuis sp.]